MTVDATGALPEQQSVPNDISQQQSSPSGTTADDNLANIANLDQSSLLNAPQQQARGSGQMPGMGPDLQMEQFVNSDQYASQQRQAMLAQQNMQQQLDQLSMEAATGYFAAPQTAYANGTAAPSGLVGAAMSKIGQPYQLGAAIGSGAWDCGSLISWAFAQQGIGGVPRYVPSMLQDPRFKNVQGGIANAQPGDVLFPTGGYGTKLGDHVVMYIGNGQILEAPHPGAPVRTMPVSEYTGYVVKRYGK